MKVFQYFRSFLSPISEPPGTLHISLFLPNGLNYRGAILPLMILPTSFLMDPKVLSASETASLHKLLSMV